MPVIKLFANLRRLAGTNEVETPAATVREAVETLCTGKADLRAAILDGDHLRPYVRVMVNGHDVELGAGLDTPIGPQDLVTVFPPIAGG